MTRREAIDFNISLLDNAEKLRRQNKAFQSNAPLHALIAPNWKAIIFTNTQTINAVCIPPLYCFITFTR